MAETSGDLKIVDFKYSDIFLKDTLGLKELYNNNKMIIKQYNCQHDEFKKSVCNRNFINEEYSLLTLTINFL